MAAMRLQSSSAPDPFSEAATVALFTLRVATPPRPPCEALLAVPQDDLSNRQKFGVHILVLPNPRM